MIFKVKVFLLVWCLLDILSQVHCNGGCLPFVDLPMQGNCPEIHSCCNDESFYSDRSCRCNKGCQNYGTCCADTIFLYYPKLNVPNLSCVDLEKFVNPNGVLAVTSCAILEHSAAELCAANTTIENDPLLFIPVTSKKTGIIYKNFFCSVCNEDVEGHEVKFWPLAIYASEIYETSVKERILKTLQYDNGIWVLNGSFVHVKFQVPAEDEDKRCLLGATFSCAENWYDTFFHQKCAEYTAYVMNQKRKVYKNPHCAICNFEKPEDLECYSKECCYYHSFSFSPALYSGLWSLDDDKIKCTPNEVFDKFAGKCRVTKCASKRYKISGRKCVPKAKPS